MGEITGRCHVFQVEMGVFWNDTIRPETTYTAVAVRHGCRIYSVMIISVLPKTCIKITDFKHGKCNKVFQMVQLRTRPMRAGNIYKEIFNKQKQYIGYNRSPLW